MSEFLEHIEVCPNCKEELEIYYTVEAGIRQLDKDTGHYNIKGDMEADLQASRQRLHRIHVLDVARYAADTLIVISPASIEASSGSFLQAGNPAGGICFRKDRKRRQRWIN